MTYLRISQWTSTQFTVKGCTVKHPKIVLPLHTLLQRTAPWCTIPVWLQHIIWTSQIRNHYTHTVTQDHFYGALYQSGYNISFERQIYLSPYPTPLAVLHDLQTSILYGTLLRDCWPHFIWPKTLNYYNYNYYNYNYNYNIWASKNDSTKCLENSMFP